MSQILENSADPGKQRPKWYDNFIYATIEGLSTKNHNHNELQKAAALALSKGGHFIEKSNAEQILDSVLLRYLFILFDFTKYVFYTKKKVHLIKITSTFFQWSFWTDFGLDQAKSGNKTKWAWLSTIVWPQKGWNIGNNLQG